MKLNLDTNEIAKISYMVDTGKDIGKIAAARKDKNLMQAGHYAFFVLNDYELAHTIDCAALEALQVIKKIEAIPEILEALIKECVDPNETQNYCLENSELLLSKYPDIDLFRQLNELCKQRFLVADFPSGAAC